MMFDVTGDRAVNRGLTIAMYALVAIAAISFVHVIENWLLMQVVLPFELIYWFGLLVLLPISLLARVAVAAGMFLCIKGIFLDWPKRLAIATMAVYALAAIFNLIGLAFAFLPVAVLDGFYPGNVSVGLTIAGTGIFLYFLMALDGNDDYVRGRGLIFPLFPIIAGVVIACGSAFYEWSFIEWIVIAATLFAAYAAYNRVQPDEAFQEPGQGK